MTIDQLNKLTDEEVRVRVAERMGWTIDEPDCAPWGWPPDPSYDRTICGEGRMECPNYSADLNAAFTLVEKLRREGWIVRIDNGLDGTFESVFSREVTPSTKPENSTYYRDQCESREEHYATAPVLARAICLTFLAVTEREEG